VFAYFIPFSNKIQKKIEEPDAAWLAYYIPYLTALFCSVFAIVHHIIYGKLDMVWSSIPYGLPYLRIGLQYYIARRNYSKLNDDKFNTGLTEKNYDIYIKGKKDGLHIVDLWSFIFSLEKNY